MNHQSLSGPPARAYYNIQKERRIIATLHLFIEVLGKPLHKDIMIQQLHAVAWELHNNHLVCSWNFLGFNEQDEACASLLFPTMSAARPEPMRRSTKEGWLHSRVQKYEEKMRTQKKKPKKLEKEHKSAQGKEHKSTKNQIKIYFVSGKQFLLDFWRFTFPLRPLAICVKPSLAICVRLERLRDLP